MKRALPEAEQVLTKKAKGTLDKPYKVVDLYCGSGGISLGFSNAGFCVVLGIDMDKDSISTYRSNFSSANVAIMDVSLLNKDLLYKMAGLSENEELDVMVAGPPCQGFSRQNKNRENEDQREGGSRNEQVVFTARLISQVNPKMFMLENVPNLNSKQGRDYLNFFSEILSNYTMKGSIFNAADYGVPQNRKRYIIIGVRNDLQVEFQEPEKTFTPSNYRTIRHAFHGLTEPPSDESDDTKFANHALQKLSRENVERLKHIPPGGGFRDLPQELMYECQKKSGRDCGWGDVFGRLDWSKPSPTITTGCYSISKGRFAHPVKNRGITMREAARIQSYPDSFVFKGSRKSVARQIGNSVPPLLATSLAQAVKRTLDTIE
jgi:DNA (cytosine-5)-methyltransferase 1